MDMLDLSRRPLLVLNLLQLINKHKQLHVMSAGAMQRWQKRYFQISGHYLKYANTQADLEADSASSKVKSFSI